MPRGRIIPLSLGIVIVVIGVVSFFQFHLGSYFVSRFQSHSLLAGGSAGGSNIHVMKGELSSHRVIIEQQTEMLNKILDHLKDKGVTGHVPSIAEVQHQDTDLTSQCEKVVQERIDSLKKELSAAYSRTVPAVSLPRIAVPAGKSCPLSNQGGGKGPGGCKVLGICIPYRDREDHLQIFAVHMAAFLEEQGIPFRIYVAEQDGNDPFNRGWALNMAFKMAQEETDYVVLHDVDMLPLAGVDYSYHPRGYQHMAVEASQFDFKNPYHRYCGGVFMLDNNLFAELNGFSSMYWGWGGEDDDFCLRLMRVKYPQNWGWPPGRDDGSAIGMPRPAQGHGRFMSISASHQTRENPFYDHNVKQLRAIERLMRGQPNPNGLSTSGNLDELTVEIDVRPLYIRKRIKLPASIRPPVAVGKVMGPHGGGVKQNEWKKDASGKWVRGARRVARKSSH